MADRIGQVALLQDRIWQESSAWRFDAVPSDTVALFTCVPTVNKATVAVTVGAADAATALGEELAALLAGFAPIHQAARAALVPTLGVSHGTVAGCTTEHGVPMAGFDHEFTTGSLFSAMAQAFMLGHIHRHQTWEEGGRVVGYAGSIGRFHHGEEGQKGFVLWEVGASVVRFEFVRTPARRTADLFFEGKPDLERIRSAVAEQQLEGAYVRVRWSVAAEDRNEVDRAAIQRALEGAADIQLEGRILPVVRSRAAGISRSGSLAEKVMAWARVTSSSSEPLLACLEELAHREPEQIAAAVLGVQGEEEAPDAGEPGQPLIASPLSAARQEPELELF